MALEEGLKMYNIPWNKGWVSQKLDWWFVYGSHELKMIWSHYMYSFPGGSAGEESTCNAGDPGLMPGLRRSPGEGNSYHSSTMVWKSPWTIHGVAKSQTQLCDFHFTSLHFIICKVLNYEFMMFLGKVQRRTMSLNRATKKNLKIGQLNYFKVPLIGEKEIIKQRKII